MLTFAEAIQGEWPLEIRASGRLLTGVVFAVLLTPEGVPALWFATAEDEPVILRPPFQYVAALNGPEREGVIRCAQRLVRRVRPPSGWKVIWWLGDSHPPSISLIPIFVVEKRRRGDAVPRL